MLALGEMYEKGIGMNVDIKRSQENYLKAAKLGEPVSQLKIARLIISGKPIYVKLPVDQNESGQDINSEE